MMTTATEKAKAQELVRSNGRALAQPTFPDPMQLGPVFAQSGLFKDASDPAKAIVKIIAGQEMGIGPMASMTGIHIINGKPTLSANLLAAQVKRHPVYNYKIREHEDDVCRIEFFEHGESAGESKFDKADADKAGVSRNDTYRKYPKAMMFARALSQGVRWYCPDVTAGSPAYVPEELGADVNEEGEPLPSSEPEVVTPDAVEPPPEPTLTHAEARAFFDRAKDVGVNGQRLSMYLTEAGVEHEPIKNIGTAVKALRRLTTEQATALEEWLHNQADAS